ncbi:hypothetical protein, partial [Ferrimicrobium sp.]|uniref:hypothetical protein n=1 Tax=Ferrimicrobium sp. TaxID=2926050 RepID=UPI0026107E07
KVRVRKYSWGTGQPYQQVMGSAKHRLFPVESLLVPIPYHNPYHANRPRADLRAVLHVRFPICLF